VILDKYAKNSTNVNPVAMICQKIVMNSHQSIFVFMIFMPTGQNWKRQVCTSELNMWVIRNEKQHVFLKYGIIYLRQWNV